VPSALKGAWSGRHWRWWTLVAGSALTGLLCGAAVLVAWAFDADSASLALLLLVVALLAISLVGAGVLDRLSARMIQGGLARQPAQQPDEAERKQSLSDTEMRRRDRLTMRAGIMVLPVFRVFLILLFN
jgi:hypothetical protein